VNNGDDDDDNDGRTTKRNKRKRKKSSSSRTAIATITTTFLGCVVVVVATSSLMVVLLRYGGSVGGLLFSTSGRYDGDDRSRRRHWRYPTQILNDADGGGRLAAAEKEVGGSSIRSSTAEGTAVAAIVTRQSNRHPFNQDRAVVVDPFFLPPLDETAALPGDTTTRTTSLSSATAAKSFLVGIFDGHSPEGHHVA